MEKYIDKIICGDNIEVLSEFESESIDLVVTSPPYDNLRVYQGFNFQFEKLVKELYRIIKKGGVIVWVVNDSIINGSKTLTSFKQAIYFKEIGFNVHDIMIYRKKNSITLNHNRYEPEFEFMFIFSKDKPKTFNPIRIKTKYKGSAINCKYNNAATIYENSAIRMNTDRIIIVKKTKIKGNVWNYNVGFNSTTKDRIAFKHPAVFPEKLAEDHISSWSNKGDIVLDPMNGSGTTTKMAKKLDRHWIGIDISQDYCNIAEKRLKLVKNSEEKEEFREKYGLMKY